MKFHNCQRTTGYDTKGPKLVLLPNEMQSSPGHKPIPAKDAGLSPVKAVTKHPGSNPNLSTIKCEIWPKDFVDKIGGPKSFLKSGPQASRHCWDQSRAWMSKRFIPPPSDVSIGAYFPRNSEAANELTNEIRSVFEYAWNFKENSYFLGLCKTSLKSSNF